MSNRKETSKETPQSAQDREDGLSGNFDDPALNEILLDTENPEPEGVVEEVVEAMGDLVKGLKEQAEVAPDGPSEAEALAALFPEPSSDVQGEPEHQMAFGMEENVKDNSSLRSGLEMALEMFSLILCEKSFDDLNESLLMALMRAVNAQAGSILEFDSEKKEFFFRASFGGGDSSTLKSFRVPEKQGIVGHVAESRQILRLSNSDLDAKQLKAISLSTGFEANTCMAAPIIVANQLYGVIELFNKNTGDAFDQKDQELLDDGLRLVSKVLEVRFLMAALARPRG